MNQFTKMITGPRQWTHPEVRKEVIQKYGELQRTNPGKNELHLYNSAVEIVRLGHRSSTQGFKVYLGIGEIK